MITVYGLILNTGKIQMNGTNDIVKTLELMCDKNSPHDKKLLLLAELVETKCEALGKNQDELKQSLTVTNDKLDKLTAILEKYEDGKNTCPVYKNKEDFERLVVFMKYPKITFFVLMGIFAALIGICSASASDILKFLLGA